MDAELVCNCRNCRKLLTTGQAWVTSCSHVFCYADGEKLIANEKKCPVCNHQFTGKMDLVRFDLNPSEAYKSMVLCGQKPDVVLDVCNRAIAFWNFQMRQETLYREYESKKLKEKYSKMEQYCNKLVSNWKIQSKALSAELQTTKVELKEVKTKFTEVNSLLREKNKNLQKIQAAYSAQKRTSISVPQEPTRSNFTPWQDMETQDTVSPKRSSLSDFVMHFSEKSGMSPPQRDPGGFNAEEFCYNASHPPSPCPIFNQPMSTNRTPIKESGFPRKLF